MEHGPSGLGLHRPGSPIDEADAKAAEYDAELARVRAKIADARKELVEAALNVSQTDLMTPVRTSYADQLRAELATDGVEFKSDADTKEHREAFHEQQGHPMGHYDESKRLISASEQEGLGPEYQSTPYVPPSVEQAEEHRHMNMFGSGHASICGTRAKDLEELGTGFALYFALLRGLCVTFFICSLMSIPGMVFAGIGGRLSLIDSIESSTLGYVTIANIDQGTASTTWSNYTSVNATTSNATATTTVSVVAPMSAVLSVFTGDVADPKHVAYVLTGCDCGVVLTILIFAFWFSRQISSYEGRYKETVTASDYAIFVHGLPKDATKEEILAHFDGLYALDRPDWEHKGQCGGCCGKKVARRPEDITDAGVETYDDRGAAVVVAKQLFPKPVKDLDHVDGDRLYLDKWVAEVSVAHPNGRAIRMYQRAKRMTLRLMDRRAKVKRALTKAGDPAAKPAQQSKARREAARHEKVVERLEHEMQEFKDHLSHAVHDLAEREHECEAAFVIFNHEESLLRCLEDYSRYRRFSATTVPTCLKFRGKHVLRVRRADEPTDVFWENIETSDGERCARKCFVWTLSIILVLLGAAGVLAATGANTSFKDSLPDMGQCTQDIPATFKGIGVYERQQQTSGTTSSSTTTTTMTTTLTTEYPIRRRELDAACPADAAGRATYFVEYNGTTRGAVGTASGPIGGTSHEACLGGCVNWHMSDAASFAPAGDRCNTTACYVPGFLADQYCATFLRRDVVACYCWGAVSTYTATYGALLGIPEMWTQEGTLCQDYIADYALSNGLYYLGVIAIVVVNTLLKIFLKALSFFEHDALVSDTNESQTLKIAIASIINTGFINLLVNANFGLDAASPLRLLFFNGEYGDFVVGWYAQIGAAIMTTLILNIVTPHISPFFKWCCLDALRRRRMRRRAVTQRHLNQAYEGTRFSVEYRYSTVIVAMTCCLLYSAGMPFLIPVAFLSFLVAYWMDKIAILRVHARPPKFPPSLARLAYWALMVAVFFHLCFAIWMYGSDTVLQSDTFRLSDLTGAEDDTAKAFDAWLLGTTAAASTTATSSTTTAVVSGGTLVARLSRYNVLPLFLILVLLVTWFFFYLVLGRLLGAVLGFACNLLCCGRCHTGSAQISPEQRRYLPAYTSRYFMHRESPDPVRGADPAVDPKSGQAVAPDLRGLTNDEIDEGWRLDELVDGQSVIVKKWPKKGFYDGVRHNAGEKKRTWEVIRDAGCHSYLIQRNPK